MELALEDLRRAADLFQPVFEASEQRRWLGLDGGVALAGQRLRREHPAAKDIHRQAARANLFVKIPGTPEGLPAIEEAIFAGIPINVTLLFSREQYLAAAEAYMRGIERRVKAKLDPRVALSLPFSSAAGMWPSRTKCPPSCTTSWASRWLRRPIRPIGRLLASPRWRELADAGARAQRLLWASTGTKDPSASDTLYVEALAAPDTIDTMPEKTLLAFGRAWFVERRHGRRRWRCRPRCSLPLSRPASIWTRWPASCRRMVQSRSWRPGSSCCSASRTRPQNLREPRHERRAWRPRVPQPYAAVFMACARAACRADGKGTSARTVCLRWRARRAHARRGGWPVRRLFKAARH